MAVELHYYGSVFELSEQYSDDHWRDLLAENTELARSERFGLYVALLLADGGSVEIAIGADSPIAIVTRPSRFVHNQSAFDMPTR